MFESSSIIVGLEVGTSKVCAVVGEAAANSPPKILGLGQARSRGVRKGEIADVTQAVEDIRNALAQAEETANVEIRAVFLGVTGGHIGGLNNRGTHAVPSVDREITQDDVDHVLQNARAADMGPDRYAIHLNRHHFTVNGQTGLRDPVGLIGPMLEVDVHVTYGNFNRLQNPIRVVKSLALEVEAVVFNGLASALAVLTPDQKEQGTLVIDMGGGTTDYALFHQSLVKHTGVLAVGGDHITNDLAYFFKVPMAAAEKLKITQGGVCVDDTVKGRTLRLKSEYGLPEKTINLEHLRRVAAERVDETLRLIEAELAEKRVLHCLRSGVVLCGGCARLPGLLRMAENIFQVPAYLGHATAVSGNQSLLEQPEFATGIGLVRFGAMHTRRKPGSFSPKNLIPTRVKETFERLLP